MIRLFFLTLILFSGISSAEEQVHEDGQGEQEEQGHEYIPEFVGIWLKNHDFNDFEINDNTLTIQSKDLSVSGAIHEVNRNEEVNSFVVESRLTVNFKGKPVAEEYVASFGDNLKEAFINSIDNLCQTVFHPIYAKLINSNDEHIIEQKIITGDTETSFYYSGYGITGDPAGAVAAKEIEALVTQELASKNYSPGIHTAKLVVAQPPDELPRIVFTLDGNEVEELPEKLANFQWPTSKEYHVGKLFIIFSQA